MSIEVLSAATCRRLLAEVAVGWIAHATEQGTHMVPVNFAIHAEELVFHTGYGQTLDATIRGRSMTFGAAVFDADTRSGWSVTVKGVPRLLGDAVVNPGLPGIEVWAELPRTVAIALPLDLMTGRQVWPHEEGAVAGSP